MKKNKTQKYVTEEQMEIKKFFFVLLGLIIIIVGVYFFTRAFVTKDLHKTTNDINYTAGEVSSDVVIVGTMLNRSEKEYYVLAFGSEDVNATYYNTIVAKYGDEKNAIKVYYLDLDNSLNKEYVASDNTASTSFTTIKELKLGKLTLMKVKEGKVTKFITNEDEIKKEFGIV